MNNQPTLLPCISRMLRELGGYWRKVFFACLLLSVSTTLTLVGSFILGRFTDAVLFNRETIPFWVLLATLALSLLANAANQLYWGQLHQAVGSSLRKKLAEKLNVIAYSWLEDCQSGDLVTRLNADMEQMLDCYENLKNMGVAFFQGLLSLVAIACLHPLLAAAHLILPAISQLLIFFSSQKMAPQFKKRQALLGEMASCSQEILGGLLEIKAAGYECAMFTRYQTRVHNFVSHLIRLESPCAATDTTLETLDRLRDVLLVAFGGLLVFDGQISMGDLLMVQMLSINVSQAVSSLNFFQLRQSIASVLRIFEVMDAPEVNHIPGKTRPVPVGPDALLVSLEKVSFTYPQRQDVHVLCEVDLTLRRGEKIAIVGPSGSGKSSILKLIAGFYVPSGGTLRVNEENWAMMDQNTFLFSDTYFQNIACGDLSASEKMVEKAAAAAEIAEFIHSTPEGFQSFCREQGKELSGGQRQRFSIARCIYRNPELLLLDEPTASLDPATEQAVMENLLTVFRDKSLLFVTHNLKLLSGFDRIYVIAQGQVVETGTHEELLNRRGLYFRMFQEGDK